MLENNNENLAREANVAATQVFFSVGRTFTDEQGSFVTLLMDKLRKDHDIHLISVGLNAFTHARPLEKVIELLDSSSGAVVLAFRRFEITDGTEKGSKLTPGTLMTTPWNHIEAAMAYDRGLPLLVLCEKGLKQDGLLERGLDWYVQEIELDEHVLNSDMFKHILNDWIQAMRKPKVAHLKPEMYKVGSFELIKRVPLPHIIGWLVALVGLLFTFFKWGMYFG